MKPPVLILCGGRGTRLRERTGELPKALVEVGGRPLLWHVISIYRNQGFGRFILLTGYLGSMIEDYVDHELRPAGIECVALDTGLDTPTGGRVAMAGELIGSEPFCLTYVDGLADIDLGAQERFHSSHGSLATVTVVRPNLQWGVAQLDALDRVEAFVEKPRMDDWVNGGFFWLEPEVLEFIEEGSILEEEPLARLASGNQLMAFRHDGFWDCVDTYKDLIAVNDLWTEGRAPWLRSS